MAKRDLYYIAFLAIKPSQGPLLFIAAILILLVIFWRLVNSLWKGGGREGGGCIGWRRVRVRNSWQKKRFSGPRLGTGLAPLLQSRTCSILPFLLLTLFLLLIFFLFTLFLILPFLLLALFLLWTLSQFFLFYFLFYFYFSLSQFNLLNVQVVLMAVFNMITIFVNIIFPPIELGLYMMHCTSSGRSHLTNWFSQRPLNSYSHCSV